MRILILALAATLLPAIAMAQKAPTQLLVYDLNTRTSFGVVNQEIGVARNVFGSRQNLSIGAFAGTSTFGQPVTGFTALFTGKAADNVFWTFGPAVFTPQAEKPSFGFGAWLTLSF